MKVMVAGREATAAYRTPFQVGDKQIDSVTKGCTLTLTNE